MRTLRQPYQQFRKTGLYEKWLSARTQWDGRRYDGLFDGVRFFGLFLGHGRSSHSLVAALYDAHPQAVMADEVDSLRYVDAGFSRQQLFTYIATAAARHARKNRQKTGHNNKPYVYQVPGQWQGRFEQPLVVGEASLATARLHDDPELLARLRRVVAVPVRFVQVVRNPYDGISRIHLLTGMPLDKAIDHYFWVCQRTAGIRQHIDPGDLLLLRNETLIRQPETCLEEMCTFFGLPAPADYRRACAGIIFKKPNQVRYAINWQSQQIDAVAAKIAAYDFLAGYSYDN
ncbi:MAG: sulfotransferase [Chloroflexi bacterium]|nr:sulfotransferase [Chloroflexota bacterium]MCI0579675.1 sulfotransferase [Chloroflexota bacterium]MCI0645885.1 sulfotransferase [Chloroflexota bacterium]MCI0725740.1 sulfotransferase [Chloroflexota bacterium]